jgi:hemoglobin/transferrin/lactoferrin receptor protein
MKKNLPAIFLFSLVLFFPFALRAQSARAGAGTLAGSVLDQRGAGVAGAFVRLKGSGTAIERVAKTGPDGRYGFDALGLGTYTLTAEAQGFAAGAVTVNVAGESVNADITLGIVTLAEEVTVTAARGETLTALTAPENVSVVGEQQIRERRALVLPQLLEGEPGVAVQQSTASQGSPYVRGLTGQQVVNLIDGVRFNNSTFRPGPNQYTALIEPADVGRIEIVRGPNAAQYGSDALGGTVNILTAQPAAFTDKMRWQGGADLFFGSADFSSGGSAFATAATRRASFIFGGAAREAQDLRAGRGLDSRAAVNRFLGLDSRVLGQRLQDTKFQQYAGFGKFIYTPSLTSLLTFNYMHTDQRSVGRYDQLNGGNGNLLNRFSPQTLDFFYTRYEKGNVGFLDSLSATFSFNGQQDGREYQGGFGDPRAIITKERNRTNAFGYGLQGATRIGARQSLVFGAEAYDEYVRASSTETNPLTGLSKSVRARFPNGARYTSLGAFAQDSVEVIRERLRLIGGFRYSLFNYRQSAARNPFQAGGVPDVTDERIRFDDVSFNVGASVRATNWLAFNAIVSRGFRAPNISDFGSIGLTSLGFEITPQAANATGATFDQLGPEIAFNYEAGAKIKTQRWEASVKFFDSEINGLIERESLVLPAGAVGRTVAGQLIIRQNEAGEVFTNLSTRPVQVRLNTEPVRLRGFEAGLRGRLSNSLSLTANTAYVRNNIKGEDGPAEFEGFTPPFNSFIALRYEPLGRKFWVEGYSLLAYKQARYSAEDFQEQRTGAARSREDIAAFFNNGAVARGLVRPGAGGVLRLVQTGETLSEVQNRVLPIGATINGVTVLNDDTGVPLYLKTAGFATLNVRAGYRFNERHALIFGLENLLDKNYRINGSGIDSPGINATLRYSFRF